MGRGSRQLDAVAGMMWYLLLMNVRYVTANQSPFICQLQHVTIGRIMVIRY
jgi:hypothetical protein